jgi:SP family sugar:H+ symporter-like MFS transporter
VGSNQTGFAVASALLGSAVGAWFAGSLADRIGRVKVMLIGAVLFVISGVLSGLAFSIVDLSIWRIIGGVGIGIASVIAPTYIAEVAPPQYRGRLGSLQQMAIVLGIFLSQLINYGLNEAANGSTTNNLWGLQAWRWMLIIEAFPRCSTAGSRCWCPSPALPDRQRPARQGRRGAQEGRGPEHRRRGPDRDIRAVISSEHRARFRDLLGRTGFFLPIVLIGIGLSVFQQFVGINVIFYYSSLLWQSVGYNVSNSLLLSVSTSIVNVIGTIVAISLIDRVGRKPLALVGSVGMSVALGVVAFAFSHVDKASGVGSISKGYGVTAIVGAHVFVFFFAMSWGVVVWVLLGEMFPNKIRALALSVAAAFQWVANFAITQSFPSMSRWSLSGSYIIYACFAFASILFVLKFVKETKGKSLEEMG